MLYFLIRVIIVAGYFALLGKANLLLNPISNTLLAFGYRGFLVFSPLVSKLTKYHSIPVCLLLSSLGIACYFFHNYYLMILGSFLVALGVSISNFFIKSETAHTSHGAALNKISANMGSFIAALILIYTFTYGKLFFFIEIMFFSLTALIAFSFSIKKIPSLTFPEQYDFKRALRWMFYGVATGIKLFAIFSIMPQYLIQYLGYLPHWYGLMIFVNSLSVVILQIVVIKFIQLFKPRNQLKVTVILMLIGMIIIATPEFFHLQLLYGALSWTFLLSIVECAASYLDIECTQTGYLLNKEITTGVGAGLTVVLSRYIHIQYSSCIIAVIGIVCLIAAYLLSNKSTMRRQN
jgi:MFS family permease